MMNHRMWFTYSTVGFGHNETDLGVDAATKLDQKTQFSGNQSGEEQTQSLLVLKVDLDSWCWGGGGRGSERAKLKHAVKRMQRVECENKSANNRGVKGVKQIGTSWPGETISYN